MKSPRKNNEDILKDWFIYRENINSNKLDTKENEYNTYFDDIYNVILDNAKEDKKEYIKNVLRKLENKLIDYTVYVEEKNYKKGFTDGIKLITEVYNNK